MSADNWTKCPKCKKQSADNKEAAEKKLKENYGKVSAEKYLEDLNKVNNWPTLSDTMREDYEIGLDEDGYFAVSYSCRCTLCGFIHKHTHKETLTPNQPQKGRDNDGRSDE